MLLAIMYDMAWFSTLKTDWSLGIFSGRSRVLLSLSGLRPGDGKKAFVNGNALILESFKVLEGLINNTALSSEWFETSVVGCLFCSVVPI